MILLKLKGPDLLIYLPNCFLVAYCRCVICCSNNMMQVWLNGLWMPCKYVTLVLHVGLLFGAFFVHGLKAADNVLTISENHHARKGRHWIWQRSPAPGLIIRLPL